jgi:hypothetical protein
MKGHSTVLLDANSVGFDILLKLIFRLGNRISGGMLPP